MDMEVERAYEFEVTVNQEQRVHILQGLRDTSKLMWVYIRSLEPPPLQHTPAGRVD
jgi:hypothetical protein